MATENTKQGAMNPAAKKATLSMTGMMILIVTTILSLRGLASQAEFGYTSIFWYVLSAIIYLVPYSLVCAELASTYTHKGGPFRWCAEAFGPKWGWAAMYMDWIMVLIWFPAVLMFGAVALAYIFWPTSFDNHLAANKIYTLCIVLGVFWLATFNTFRGQKFANKLSTLGGLFGTIIPGAILIILGIIYICTGGTNEITPHQDFWPDFEKYSTIVLAASIFLFYGGMEMQAVHVNDMPNPSKTFPRSVFFAVIIILAIFIAGTLTIGFIEPRKDINLLASLLIAYNGLWAHLGVPWLGNVMAVFITFGVLGQVSAIIAGPSAGILAVGKSGYLPKSWQKTNKNGIQTTLLWIQLVWVSILSLVLIVLPSVESAYQILSQLSTIIYLVMVIIIYAAFVRLRRTEPNQKRGFKIPGGDFMKWLIGIVGIVGAVLASILSFLPPSQINTGSPAVYIIILIVGFVVLISVPFIIYACRKPSWRDPDSDFYPFNWEIEGRKPGTVSKWPVGYQPTKSQVERAMEWQDGELGPVSMNDVAVVDDLTVKPEMPTAHMKNLTDDDKPKDDEIIDDSKAAPPEVKQPAEAPPKSVKPAPPEGITPAEKEQLIEEADKLEEEAIKDYDEALKPTETPDENTEEKQ